MSEKLIPYHGSRGGIVGDITPCSKNACDFGRGFYLGTNKEQAETLVCNDDRPVLYNIQLDLNGLNVLYLDNARDWYFTIAYNRKRMEEYKEYKIYKYYSSYLDNYDVVIGTIADDSIYQSLNLFFSSNLIEEALIAYLTALDLGTQYVCKTQKACKKLKIISEKYYNKVDLESIIKSREEKILQTKKNINKIKETYEGKAGITFNQIIKNYG